jgi:hypothetical protein
VVRVGGFLPSVGLWFSVLAVLWRFGLANQTVFVVGRLFHGCGIEVSCVGGQAGYNPAGGGVSSFYFSFGVPGVAFCFAFGRFRTAADCTACPTALFCPVTGLRSRPFPACGDGSGAGPRWCSCCMCSCDFTLFNVTIAIYFMSISLVCGFRLHFSFLFFGAGVFATGLIGIAFGY